MQKPVLVFYMVSLWVLPIASSAAQRSRGLQSMASQAAPFQPGPLYQGPTVAASLQIQHSVSNSS